MRPKNLQHPFSWEERRPLIRDRVLFVPQYYSSHQQWTFPGWESPEVFGREAPIAVEYCTGNGTWIVEKARAHPERHWIAVEKKFDRVRKIWSKMHNFSLSNLFIVCGEALVFTQCYAADCSFDAIYINFPDPWPKQKHAKNRLLQGAFLTEMARVCAAGAAVTIVTDHLVYATEIHLAMSESSLWESRFLQPFYTTQWENYGTSYFDSLWRGQGLPIHYMQYFKVGGVRE
jgi:tRNA (guanine-N7-)-methyltransferase